MWRWIVFDWSKAIEISLRTWYPKDHDLHLSPHHPLGKLLEEWGELMGEIETRVRARRTVGSGG